MTYHLYAVGYMKLMVLSHERIFRRLTRCMGTFSNTSRSLYTSFVYAGIRFETFSYGEAARGVLSAQNFPTYESV